MADPYDEMANEVLANDPSYNPLRLTVRPQGVTLPPPSDVDTGWGATTGPAGRPAGRLFEPDQTPVHPTIGERIGISPVESWPSWGDVGRGIGSLVQGAGDFLSRPPSEPEGGSRLSPVPLPPVSDDPFQRAAQRTGAKYGAAAQERPTLPAALAQGVINIPSDIQQGYEASQARLDPTLTQEQRDAALGTAAEKAFGITANLAGTSAPFARAGTAGVFGGRLAQGFDPNMEKLAETMLQNGLPAPQIWKETGMVKFADGKWAHEISDLGAYYKGNDFKLRLKLQQGEQIYLPDVIDHPELFAKYPELRAMPVSHDAVMQASGGYMARHPDTPQGKIVYREEGKEPRGQTFDTLLHEIQHGISNIENMAKGANPSYIAPGSAADKLYQGMMAKMPPGLPAKRQAQFEQYARQVAGLEGYQKSAGENVANLAAQRKDFTPAQATAVYPPAQMRVPLEQQKPFVEFNAPYGGQGELPLSSVLNPVQREMQMSGPSGLMPPKSQRQATGSFNPLDEADVTWKGKPMAQWKPQDWKEVGDHYGVKNLGPLSPVERYVSPDGYAFEIPGGTKGTWTYYDLLHMKANPINPNYLPHDLHIEMQKKLGRTMTPHGEVGQDQIWNGLMFGMTSQNNPLFPNQMSASRLRLRDPKMLESLADAVPWEPGATHTRTGEPITKEMRTAYDRAIGRQFGIGAGPEGLGTRGSINYTYVSELAQMFRKNPEWFRKKPDEDWTSFVERLATQTKGLSMKTGSFGSVWQDPAHAAISAIDRHMVKEFDRRGGLFLNPAEQDAWRTSTLAKWNKELPADQRVGSWQELTQKSGSDGFIGKKLLEYVGSHDEPKFRVAKTGAIHPDVQPHLAAQKWINEPDKVVQVGAAYKRALAANQKAANEQGLNLFMSQWYEWDRIRQRFEPHENMFPGLSQMPAPSRRQLEIPNIAHAETGHKTYEKGPTGQLQPTKKFSRNPSEMGYLGIPLAAGAAAGGIGSLVQPNRQEVY